jgi:hypothetical protein
MELERAVFMRVLGSICALDTSAHNSPLGTNLGTVFVLLFSLQARCSLVDSSRNGEYGGSPSHHQAPVAPSCRTSLAFFLPTPYIFERHEKRSFDRVQRTDFLVDTLLTMRGRDTHPIVGRKGKEEGARRSSPMSMLQRTVQLPNHDRANNGSLVCANSLATGR